MLTGRFKLFIQFPKPSKKPVEGTFCAAGLSGKPVEALFCTGDAGKDDVIVAKLERPEVVYANTHGIMFRGYEPTGADRSGVPTFRYQEWWCVYAK